ncbi:MAG: ATP-binding protein [Bacillota bacterium]|nr:ATP-binding protein [Bacillota bacterium]
MNFKRIKGAKISVKLTIVYALMFSFVLLVMSASILYGVRFYLLKQAGGQIEDVKSILETKLTSNEGKEDLADKEFLSDIPVEQNISIKLVKEDGKVINISRGFNYDINFQGPYDKIIRISSGDEHLLYKVLKISSNGYGTVYIEIVKNLDTEYDFMMILFAFMAGADLLGVIVSIILGYMVSKRMLRPIDNITKTAEKITINNLKERIDVRGPEDELKRLGNTFNNMIDRLQEAFDRQAQFVSDASHELRTPIAVIQGYANLLHRWGKDDREALEKSIAGIRLEAANMGALVESLLILAKGESGTLSVEKKEIWLNELINEVASESKIIAQKHVISCEQNDNVKILGDYKMLKQMLRIFIDNSIKFSPENSEIDISSETAEGKVKITVSDRGIGIPKDEVERIFDRFYTVDKSRSREKGGTGLGLSIAKWIAEQHNGTINVESEEGKYTRITVILNEQ